MKGMKETVRTPAPAASCLTLCFPFQRAAGRPAGSPAADVTNGEPTADAVPADAAGTRRPRHSRSLRLMKPV